MRRRQSRARIGFSVCAAVLGSMLMTARPAGASAIIEPPTSPIVVAFAGSAPPAPITVVANGFAPGSLVYVEQCDGVGPTTPQWSPTVHCDLGSSPSPAIADGGGLVTFSSTDPNRAFRPFEGESPQSLFNCLAPLQRSPANGLANFTDCRLRVSTSNTVVTSDQTFLAMVFTGSLSSTSPTPHGTATSPASRAANGASASRSTVGSRRRPSHGDTAAGRSAASSRSVVVTASRHPKRGLLALSDADLATGCILVLGGLLITAVSIAVRRRDAGRVGAVTGTKIVGER